MSLEDLMNLEVTSVAKKELRLLDAPQAIEVVTAEDLHRSGLISIPEALRMVPGLSVASIDANKWAIGSRGFNDRFANKLLVLVDGRSVYSPLFSGVHWDVQDLVLEDVERIEVIRGPGATLWGANAVSGVINVITKPSAETRGGYAEAGLDALRRADGPAFGGLLGTLRYGLRLSEKTFARVYGKHLEQQDDEDAGGNAADDAWSTWRTGFRLDREARPATLMLQGDLYSLTSGGRVPIPLPEYPYERLTAADGHASGGHLLARWRRGFSNRSEMIVQSYYDQTWRDDAIHREKRRTFDLDVQHRAALGARTELVMGLAYRLTGDDVVGHSGRSISPQRRQDQLVSGFVQGEVSLAGGRLRATAGSRLEHNDYSGFEIGPGLRLLAKPAKRLSLWAAVARAVRTPSRIEHDMNAQLGATTAATNLVYLGMFEGNPAFASEKLVAYEIGGRGELTTHLVLDAALHYDVYADLRTFEPDFSRATVLPEEAFLRLPFLLENRMAGRTYGGELSARWTPYRRLRLVAGYTLLRMELTPDPDSRDPWAKEAEGYIPRHQLHLRAATDLPRRLSLDAALYWVAQRPNEGIAAYARLDARVAWRATPRLELSVGGRNLTTRRHRETAVEVLSSTAYVPQSLHVKAAWRF